MYILETQIQYRECFLGGMNCSLKVSWYSLGLTGDRRSLWCSDKFNLDIKL